MMLKLSIPKSLNLQLELDRLGVSADHRFGELSIYQFPEVVREEYIPAWEKFIEADAIQELYAMGTTNIQGIFYAALSFVSYINTISSNAFNSKYDHSNINLKQLQGSFGIVAERFKHTLYKKGFKQFKKIDQLVVLKDTYHVLANGNVGISGDIYIRYAPAKRHKLKQGTFTKTLGTNDLDSLLYKNSNYLFGTSSVPEKMLGTSRKLGNGKTKNVYPKVNNLEKINRFKWHNLVSYPIDIYCIRTGENDFALRIPFNLPTMYLSFSDSRSITENQIKKSILNMLR